MSKKKNDQTFISDLLGKLKASYSEQESKPEPQKAPPKSDTADDEFQKQLEAMLNKTASPSATVKEDKPKATQKKAEKKATRGVKEKEAPIAPKKETAATKKKASAKASKKKETPVISELVEPTADIPTSVEEPTSIREEETIAVSLPLDFSEEVHQPTPIEPLILQEEIIEPIEEIAFEETVSNEEISVAETEDILSVSSQADEKKGSETIVIRPKQVKAPKQETIVIRPRTPEKPAVTPKPLQQEAANKPIKIGKEAPKQVKASTVKKEQTVSKASEPPSTPSSAAHSTAQTTEKKRRVVRVVSKKEAVKPTATVTPKAKPQEIKAAPVPPAKIQEKPVSIPTQEPVAEPKQMAPEKPLEPIQATTPEKREIPLSFPEQIKQKTGLSEDDIELLFALGYEGELANLVGDDALKKLKSAHLRKKGRNEKNIYPTAFGYRDKEYVGKEDQSGVLSAYVHDRGRLIVRLILSALCTLCLLFLEHSVLRSTYSPALFLSHPWASHVISILLLVASTALSFTQIWNGLKSLFRFTASPYSVCGVLLIPALIYDLIALFKSSLTFPVNFPVSLAILVTVVCDVFRVCCEMRVFRLLCAKGEKNVLKSTSLRKKKVKQGEKTVKILNDEVGESFYHVVKANEITGFFRRFNTMLGASRTFTLLILSSLSVALALSFATAIKTHSLSASATAFIAFLIVGAPLSSIFGFFYSLFHANRILSHHQCALIGEESVEEYCLNKTVIFEDGEMFHTEKCTETILDEGGDFQNDIKLASALFQKIGSTLAPIGQAIASSDDELQVSLLRIAENGVEAEVNTHRLLAGDASFLKKNAIRVPKESSDRALRRTVNVRVMYVAIDGTVKLHYEIEYTEKSSFEKTAEALLESNTGVAIRSYDPNLNNAFVQQLRHGKLELIRVIKPGRYEENSALELVDAGALSLDAPEKTVCALHAAAKIGKARGFTTRMQLIATLLGSIGAFLITLFGGGSLDILHIALYHLFWIAVSLVATHLEITENKLHLFK